MEKQERKANRLAEYDYTQEGAYFITLCTQGRTHLFEMECSVENGLHAVSGSSYSNQIIHKWIRETQNKFDNITIDKYVVMPDHLHLLLTIKERHIGRSLPDIVVFLKTMTTNEYIKGGESWFSACF